MSSDGLRRSIYDRPKSDDREVEMLLEGKNAIAYGAGGGIGGGVARTFAREGAALFLAGRTGVPVEAVAADIRAAGGSAQAVPDRDQRLPDALRSSRRRVPSLHSFAEVPWLQPYPDRLLDGLAPSDAEPDAVVVARETIELTYLAVIQLLPPRQRAVVILRDVLERSAAAAALVRDDIRITMPPHPWVLEGLAAIRPLLEQGLTEPGEWRLVPTRANRQPTAASYLRAPGDTEFRAFKFDVLRVEAA
jgi:NAD(P)-dependent dehydrogenase (short-subunit alcohol dehydrogenase family)